MIFDCDGVLVASEPITNRVLAEVLGAHGADMTAESCAARFTGTSRHAVAAFMQDRGTPLPDSWAEDFYARAFDALRREVTPIPGARELLSRLSSASLPFCVASNGTVEKMRLTLTTCGLAGLVGNALFSGYDVGAPKPAPDVFLKAAARFDTAPEDCIVIEDSPTGFSAAAAAGMRCLAYRPGGTAPQPLHGAIPFPDLADLPRLLGLD